MCKTPKDSVIRNNQRKEMPPATRGKSTQPNYTNQRTKRTNERSRQADELRRAL